MQPTDAPPGPAALNRAGLGVCAQEVWSPAGGWWTRPSNWKTNTGFVALGLGLAVYGVWQMSADREVRPLPPSA